MQETVSGYKFRTFHHCPGGRVWGRQAVVELAACWFGCRLPVNSSWKTRAQFHAKRWALPQGARALVLGWCGDSLAEARAGDPPKSLVVSGSCDTAEAVEVCMDAQIHTLSIWANNNRPALRFPNA